MQLMNSQLQFFLNATIHYYFIFQCLPLTDLVPPAVLRNPCFAEMNLEIFRPSEVSRRPTSGSRRTSQDRAIRSWKNKFQSWKQILLEL
jgi:hypothetical protein